MQGCGISPDELEHHVIVLRLGHRAQRDKRVTTHVALVARAFGARGILIAGDHDEKLLEGIADVARRWGGWSYFRAVHCPDPLRTLKELKREGFCVIHLTMYGLPVDNVIGSIRSRCRKIVVIVGAEKVPRAYYEIADYNVAIGNQPHSEVAALALFLDRLWSGKELSLCFPDAKIRVEPQSRGKKVVELG